MKRLLLIIACLALTSVACGASGSGGLPTLVPTINLDNLNIESNPVEQPPIGDTPRESNIPQVTETPTVTPIGGIEPTWTPVPTVTPRNTSTPAPFRVTVAPPITIPPNGQVYTVQPGDTLAKIAARFNKTVSEIANANNITNINRIEVGDQLIIPR